MSQRWPRVYPDLLSFEGKPLPAALLRPAVIVTPRRSRWRAPTAIGVLLLFGLAAGGAYYWPSGRQHRAVAVPTPPKAEDVTPKGVNAATSQSTSRLVVGLPAISDHDQDIVSQKEPLPNRTPTYEVGLSLLATQILPDAPPPADAAEPGTTTAVAVLPPKPPRKPGTHRSSTRTSKEVRF